MTLTQADLERIAFLGAVWLDNRRSLDHLRMSVEPSTPEGRANVEAFSLTVDRQRDAFINALERATTTTTSKGDR